MKKLDCNLIFEKELYTQIAQRAVPGRTSFNDVVESILRDYIESEKQDNNSPLRDTNTYIENGKKVNKNNA